MKKDFKNMTVYNLPVNYDNLSRRERRDVRGQYIKEQGGLCCYCHKPLEGEPSKEVLEYNVFWRLFPRNFLDNPVHLHHHHDSGLTIGAVHARCNAVSWQKDGV